MVKYTLTDFKRDFPDDNACLEYLKNTRWPNGITCKKCQRATKHHRVSKRLCYACDFCGTHVYPQAGTILQDSRTPLTFWFRVIFLMAATRMGIVAKHIERELGVTYKTAWRMCWMVRRMMNENASIQKLLGETEIDEGYFRGSESNKHLNKRNAHKRMSKQPVLGMVERQGRVFATTIPLP
jgi:Transposase zinc-ribbon domain/ISXO2-like transposase domain